MIQIPNWAIFGTILAIAVLISCYFFYFRISRKLFPQVSEFQETINPNEEATLSTVTGSGIIKRVEVQMSMSKGSVMVLIVDRTSHVTIASGKGKETTQEGSPPETSAEVQRLEINTYRPFSEEFSLFIANSDNKILILSGKISYEIKKSLKESVSALLGELR